LRRVLALDVGSIHIGLALSDPLGLTAQPLPTWIRHNLEADLAGLLRLIRERGVKEVVVGLPINLKGIETPQTEKVRRFAEALQARLAFPIRYWDERLTTTQALRTLRHAKRRPSRERGLVDQVAAVYILQAYLDSHKDSPGV
jgi:putative Holliday junction resolvase